MAVKELLTVMYYTNEDGKSFMQVMQIGYPVTQIDVTHHNPIQVVSTIVESLNKALDPIGPTANQIPF